MAKGMTVIFDATYLCHKTRWTSGLNELSFKEIPTGIAYGVLRDMDIVRDIFAPVGRMVWAFDHRVNKRKELFSGYKANRKKESMTSEEKREERIFYQQMEHLRSEILPGMGFRNVFCEEGYEADDIIAYVLQNSLKDSEATIVTTDEDMYQCLTPKVSMFSPKSKRIYDYDWFIDTYGIEPKDWAKVKAIAGCSSDNVPGIRGVGVITAAKWLRNDLKPTSQMYKSIDSHGQQCLKINLPLVKLPYPGLPDLNVVDDEVTEKSLTQWKKSLGFRVNERENPKPRGFI